MIRLLLFSRGDRWFHTIYDCDEMYQFLNPGDVIGVDKTEDRDTKRPLIKITNKRQERGEGFLKRLSRRGGEEQIGRTLNSNDTITIYGVQDRNRMAAGEELTG
jgi:hypothetical protein